MEFIVILVLVALGYFFGQSIEKKHYKSLIQREKVVVQIPVITGEWKSDLEGGEQGQLFFGSVVVASDYFKTFVSGLKGLLGGRLNAYETLLDRGRREAVLRMKEDAKQWGAERIVNMRLETANVGGRGLPSIEVFAYGTAIKKEHG